MRMSLQRILIGMNFNACTDQVVIERHPSRACLQWDFLTGAVCHKVQSFCTDLILWNFVTDRAQ